jgi:hypothetical protein
MSTSIDDDIKVNSGFLHKRIQKINICLVAGEDSRLGHVLGPLLRAGGVGFDEVEVDVGEVFQPGVEAGARAVGHVAVETYLEHFDMFVAIVGEVFLIKIIVSRDVVGLDDAASAYFIYMLVVMRGHLFGPIGECHFVERRSGVRMTRLASTYEFQALPIYEPARGLMKTASARPSRFPRLQYAFILVDYGDHKK